MDNSAGGTSTSDYAWAAANDAERRLKSLEARVKDLEVAQGICPCPYPMPLRLTFGESFGLRYGGFVIHR